MSELQGRVVAITGASSGIGEATALACARAGASVALAARRTERIEALADRIGQAGGEALAVTADVGEEHEANAFVTRTHERFGRLDALVNNAGVMLLGPIEGAPTEEWRRMIHVNVLGVLYCTHSALPLMHAQGGGDIVNVSSVGGRVLGRYSGVYSLTKFGIGAFSEALRQENVDTGIRVTLIEPGGSKRSFGATCARRSCASSAAVSPASCRCRPMTSRGRFSTPSASPRASASTRSCCARPTSRCSAAARPPERVDRCRADPPGSATHCRDVRRS